MQQIYNCNGKQHLNYIYPYLTGLYISDQSAAKPVLGVQESVLAILVKGKLKKEKLKPLNNDLKNYDNKVNFV